MIKIIMVLNEDFKINSQKKNLKLALPIFAFKNHDYLALLTIKLLIPLI